MKWRNTCPNKIESKQFGTQTGSRAAGVFFFWVHYRVSGCRTAAGLLAHQHSTLDGIQCIYGPSRPDWGHHVYVSVSPPFLVTPIRHWQSSSHSQVLLRFFLSGLPSELSEGGRAKVRHALADVNGDILINLFKIQDIDIKPPVLCSEEVMSTPASVILPSWLTKAKLVSVNLYPTHLVPLQVHQQKKTCL